jgi:peptidyl-prolyl cis-trans isomerase D
MELFRKLAGNIFFKIILAFVALTFVLFGVSEFILGSPNAWVVKIGGSSISYNTFTKALQADREIILNSNKSEQALQYVDSEQFKSDVLGRMVNKVMVEKLREDYGVEASRKIILEAVAKNPSFKKDGKFDHELFKKFLAKGGFNEERYINEIAGEVTATMIIQTLALSAPLNDKMIIEAENFKQEKRLADVITISAKNVGIVAAPTSEEVQKFYDENKQQYAVSETRKVSYLHFSKGDFAKDLQVSEADLKNEYEQNKDQFLKPESRNFYQILFDDEAKAKAFLQQLKDVVGSDKSKLKAEFVKLAKEQQKKDLKAITLNDITAKGVTPELAVPIFKMNVNDVSDVLASPLGFHVFLLNEINQAKPLDFAEVKDSIRKKLLQGREEKVVQEKISAIDDALLTANSLDEVAKKFNLKASANPVIISKETGDKIAQIKALEGFAENAFALKKDQISKIFFNQNSADYYAIKIEEITPAHERSLDEIKVQVTADLAAQLKQGALQNLAQKIADELKKNPASLAQIIAKHQLKLEKNREFPRIFYIEFQGHKVPYQNKFLDEIFAVKVGEATSANASGPQEFSIAILRNVKKAQIDSTKYAEVKKAAADSFKEEILQEFNKSLLAKYPVKVNEKLLGGKEAKK